MFVLNFYKTLTFREIFFFWRGGGKRRAKIHINLPIFLTKVCYEASNRGDLVSKVLSFKLHANKMKMGQTMDEFTVIIPNKISLKVFLLSG